MADAQLQVVIKARNQAKAEFDSLNKQVGQLQGSKGFGGLKGKIAGVDGAFQKLTGVSMLAGGAIGVAGMALKAMADYSKVAIDAASNLSETEAKVGVVFGDQADNMLAWGESAAESMGMSSNAALAAAGTYGNLFRAMGMGVETSASMSKNLVKLAADLASFNNMDPTEVLDKLRAGLSGETEPLKTLGVNLNQAAIQAKALEMGLVDGAGAMDASAKAQATYALILEQTTLAQGDFARTSEGLANQQRILKANTDDLAAAIGESLLPTKTKWVELLNDVTEGTLKLVEAKNREKRILESTLDLTETQNKRFEELMTYYSEMGMYGEEAYTTTMNNLRANEAWSARLEAQAATFDEYTAAMEEAKNEGDDYYKGFQTIANEERSYKENLTEIRTNIRELTAEKQTLIEKYGAESSQVAEITGKLREQGIAAQGLADAHETATQRIILGFIEQELAMGGLTREESGYLIDLGTKWGIYGEDMKGAYESAMDSVDNFVRMQNKVIPKQTIELNVIVTGEGAGILMGGVAKAGSKMIEMGKARGGPVSANTPYIVGEAGPELFVPNSSGNIVPNNKLTGGTIINFNYAPALSLSDRAEFETRVIPMMRRLISKAG